MYDDYDLLPESEISSIHTELEGVLHEYEKYVPKDELDMNDWYKVLATNKELRTVKEIHGPSLVEEDQLQWYWRSDNDTITIYIRIDKNEPIDITTTEIKSSVLSGTFWDEIEILNFERNTIRTLITIRSHSHFPVLIKGGDADPLSMYLLAMLSIRIKRIDYFIKWNRLSAYRKCHQAAHFLGRYLMTTPNLNEAVYWLANSTHYHNDTATSVSLASLLITDRVAKQYYELSEHLLCRATVDGDEDARDLLGRLYLNGGGTVPKDHPKALRLLKSSAENYGMDEDTIKVLQKAEKEVSKFSFIDAFLASGIIAGGVYGAYRIFRYFRK